MKTANSCFVATRNFKLPMHATFWRLISMVWIAGFEPATSCSQSKCSTKLNYIQLYGADNENRTRDFWLEARHFTSKLHLHICESHSSAESWDIPFV